MPLELRENQLEFHARGVARALGVMETRFGRRKKEPPIKPVFSQTQIDIHNIWVEHTLRKVIANERLAAINSGLGFDNPETSNERVRGVMAGIKASEERYFIICGEPAEICVIPDQGDRFDRPLIPLGYKQFIDFPAQPSRSIPGMFGDLPSPPQAPPNMASPLPSQS